MNMYHVMIRAKQNHGRLKMNLCIGSYETIEEANKVKEQNMFSYIEIKPKEECEFCKDK